MFPPWREKRLLPGTRHLSAMSLVRLSSMRGLTVSSPVASCSIGRWGGFCSDLPRWASFLTLAIRFRFAVLFYVLCYFFLRLERNFTLFFRKILWYVYIRLNAFFASRRDGSAVLNLEFFFDEGHSKSRRNCCYISSSICLGIYFNVFARFSRGRLRKVRGNG